MIKKSEGKTRTEKILSELCENTFLNTWSFPNPYNEKGKGKEFCDLVAIFENHMFIFFDREKILDISVDNDSKIQWDRWKRNVIDAQAKTCHGAERYIKNGGNLFLDPECLIPLPIKYDSKEIIIHKVIIANGASDACVDFSDENINGSLGITYRNIESHDGFEFPFLIDIDKNNPVHIFDEYTFPLVLRELDTFKDFLYYITAKEDTIRELNFLSYCGEEDLLAHYLMNFDNNTKKHFIGSCSEK